MPNGYWGQVLLVDLTTGKAEPKRLPEEVYRRFLGGYGLGAAILFEQLPAKTDPLGPGNMLGFLPGLLTGSGAPFSGRWMVVGRSPLTGAWGDSNCGGDFGPSLRGTGYDGVLVRGAAERPVYLFIDEDHAEVRDASDLWGLDTGQTESAIRSLTGPEVRVACIGPAGEKRSLISCLVNDGGRVAGRCGLGAVMGAKRLKAVAVQGKRRLPLASPEAFREAAAEYRQLFRHKPTGLASRIPALLGSVLPILRRLRSRPSGGPAQLVIDTYRRYGTASGTALLVELGDTPVRNWTGIGFRDFPLDLSEGLSDEAVIQNVMRPYACQACPVACGAIVNLPNGGTGRKPEYETLGALGPLVMNSSLDDVMRCSETCNQAGLDTISVGGVVAFALECAEKGWLPPDLRDELPLRWGDGQGMVELVHRIARRQAGLGEWLADGVRVAARRLGPAAQEAAIHAGGQELPMHRGLYEPAVAAGYEVDPAPGRHGSTFSGAVGAAAFAPYFALHGRKPAGRYDYKERGSTAAIVMSVLRAFDSLGLCQFALNMGRPPFLEWLNAATGWGFDAAKLYRTGQRIQILRHAFNAREGLPSRFPLPARERGDPPQEIGPTAGRRLDMDTMAAGYFQMLGLDPSTGFPLAETARELGLEQILVPPDRR